VKWTYEQVTNPENGNIMAGPLAEIEEIEVLDESNTYLPFLRALWALGKSHVVRNLLGKII